MTRTSVSLLERVRESDDDRAWTQLVEVYTPLIHQWLNRYAVATNDRDDLAQEVLVVVMRLLPSFEHNQRIGAFRAWLRRITVNCLRDFWKSNRIRPLGADDSQLRNAINQLEDPHSGLSQVWDREHDIHVTRQLLERIEKQFQPTTWEAFRRVALEGADVAEVAEELNMTANAIYAAKSRILTRLRQEAEGLLDTQ